MKNAVVPQHISMTPPEHIFSQWLKTCRMWPPRLSDLKHCNYNMRGTTKYKAHIKNPHKLQNIKDNV